MELSNTFEVKAPIEEAWTKLTDLELIAPAMPGAQLEEVEGDEYRGTVKVKVGPITAKYKGTAKIVDKDDDARMVIIDAKGRDTRGQGNANAVITAQLTEAGADTTKVELVTDLTLTGKVAQFARGVLSDVSAKLIGQFVDNLESDVFGDAPAGDSDQATSGKVAASDTATDDASVAAASDSTPDDDATAAATTADAAVASTTESPAAKTSGDKPKVSDKSSTANTGTASVATSADDTDAAAAPAPAPAPAETTGDTPTASGKAAGSSGTSQPPATAGSPAAPAGVRKISSPEAEAVDLLDSAGAPLAKRLLPALGLLGIVLLIIRVLRNRSSS